ncbi:MAG: MFS transporter [Cyclobacteriaceae bacterium]|nr:MFS transporter [Cyclobacteriaceae bacterium]
MIAESGKLYTSKFWLLCASSFFFFSSFNLIIPELPDFLTEIGGGDHKGLIIPLFTLMAGISRPFSGRLTDTIGRIPIILYGAIVCIVVGFVYPLVTTVIGFFALRVVHGMSTGFKPTATSAYVGDIAPVHRRGEAMGILGLFGSLGMAAGPILGSWIALNYGYNPMFYASSVLAILSTIVVLNMPETLLIRQQFRMSLMKLRRKDILEPKAFPAAITMAFTSFAYGEILTIVPDLSKHLGVMNKGVFFAIFTISSIAIRVVAGKLSDRIGRVPVLMVGCVFQAVALIFLGVSTEVWLFYTGAFIFGVSTGLTSPAIYAWTIDLADDQYRGRALCHHVYSA